MPPMGFHRKMFNHCMRISDFVEAIFNIRVHRHIVLPTKKFRVAVVLSGNGVYDGTEINEASAVLINLSRNGVAATCYAPDESQMHTINHMKGVEDKGWPRNVMIESSRISVNGQIKPLYDLTSRAADAVIFPGGFGVAKHLSNFAVDGANMTVNEEVARVIKEYNTAQKPIGFCCIAPILAAKVLGHKNVEVTLGKKDDGTGTWPHGGAIDAANAMGAATIDAEVNEVVIDEKNLVVSTPAFMYNGKFHEIHDGIALMVKNVIQLIR